MWAESTDVIGDFGLLSSDPIQRSIPGPGQMPLLSPDISATILDPPLQGAMNVELTIRSKTLLTTFFVIDGKGSYSLLLGHDWIHANYCVPSTMYQCLIQWHGDDVELVHADDSVSIATANPVYWELEEF